MSELSNISTTDINVLAHYYLDREYNPFSMWQKRLAVEVEKLPNIDDSIIITPKWMYMNETRQDPGIYRVIDILPNANNPHPVYDYTPYKSWFNLQLMSMIVVKPIYTITASKFKKYAFTFINNIDDQGIVKEQLIVLNTDTGETKEVSM